MIPTDGGLAGSGGGHTFTPPMLAWLQGVLSQASKTYRYLFVVGNKPAFSLTATFFVPRSPGHLVFWKTLVNNNVLAYFASHEHFFDRSNRQGVWQVISGGGGASFRAGSLNKPFFHCLILTIPQQADQVPFVQVVDVNGTVSDEFELTPVSKVLYERHISGA